MLLTIPNNANYIGIDTEGRVISSVHKLTLDTAFEYSRFMGKINTFYIPKKFQVTKLPELHKNEQRFLNRYLEIVIFNGNSYKEWVLTELLISGE